MLPEFVEPSGYLPAGIHSAPWSEVRDRFGWNRHRVTLLDQLGVALRALEGAGCMSVILNGSFVTAKAHPADYDLLFEAHTVTPRLLPDWIGDRGHAGGDIVAIHNESFSGRRMLELFQTDRDGVAKGVVRIRLSSLGPRREEAG